MTFTKDWMDHTTASWKSINLYLDWNQVLTILKTMTTEIKPEHWPEVNHDQNYDRNLFIGMSTQADHS